MKPVLENYNPPKEPYLEVIHEDPNFLVINKPSGLLSVPGKTDALRDCLEWRAQKIYGSVKAVHRLDMDTSGLILISLSPNAHANLSKQFEDRLVKKVYIARVFGLVMEDKGEINLPLACDWPNRPIQKVDYKLGKPALTYFKVLKKEKKTSLMEFSPQTGRSHQLRVHASSMGHPIIGDKFYATGEALTMARRLNLHAQRIEFNHPASGCLLKFEVQFDF
ncbi:MAG: RluA family pseudouridine synthase [Sphingomonadales bacterium]